MRTQHLDVKYVFKQDTSGTHAHRQKRITKKKKRQAHKPKGWQVSDPHLSEEEEEETMKNQVEDAKGQHGNQAEGSDAAHPVLENVTKSSLRNLYHYVSM